MEDVRSQAIVGLWNFTLKTLKIKGRWAIVVRYHQPANVLIWLWGISSLTVCLVSISIKYINTYVLPPQFHRDIKYALRIIVELLVVGHVKPVSIILRAGKDDYHKIGIPISVPRIYAVVGLSVHTLNIWKSEYRDSARSQGSILILYSINK